VPARKLRHFLKAAVHSFLGVKNDPKYIFEKIDNQPVFKG